jgi:hypothetical protein
MMAMLDLIDDGCEFTSQSLVQADPEDLADAVGGQPPESYLAASFKDLVNGEMAFENEVAAVLDLSDGVEARQVHLTSLILGELGTEVEGPVIELFADDSGAQAIRGCLQGSQVVHDEEGVVIFVEADAGALQFSLDEGVTVEPIGSMERKETGDTDDDRSQNLIANVEVVMRKAAALVREDAIVGVLGGIRCGPVPCF